MKRILFAFAMLAALTACGAMQGPGAYESGLKANVDQYRLQTDVQLAQQQAIQTCYQHNPNKSECAINQASTNAVQTLAGGPKPLRIASSVGEIIQAIADKGMDTAKVIYGVKAVQAAIEANAAAMGSTAQAGIEAAAKDPLVIQPGVFAPPGTLQSVD